ncbi:MAG TPA: DUF853 family protein, partial [Leptospiraceae bacterium]|nr:DUF853 family protein [Leptospiraceae bacterium]
MIIGKTVPNTNSFFSSEDSKVVELFPKVANRHGIIAGMSGSGKTVTMRVLLEQFSKHGIPVLATDIKGDLSSISNKSEQRKSSDWKPYQFPVKFWDVFGKSGENLQATIDELGVLLVSRMLGLTEAQSSVLSSVFDLADKLGKKVASLDHILSALKYLTSAGYKISGEEFGIMSSSSVGVIQRKIFELKRNGGDKFFNDSGFCLDKLIKLNKRSEGVINILNSVELVKFPTIYATFVVWILNKLYDELPEVGNLDKPKFAIFIDEAHLLFGGIQKSLLSKIEQAVRLIRSKAVGVYLITQNPADIPDSISSQIGNRIIHNLSGFSTRERRNIKTIAESFPQNTMLNAQDEIISLATGHALVSFLDQNGKPQPVEKVKINLPQ